jgi:hypothetical protein
MKEKEIPDSFYEMSGISEVFGKTDFSWNSD